MIESVITYTSRSVEACQVYQGVERYDLLTGKYFYTLVDFLHVAHRSDQDDYSMR